MKKDEERLKVIDNIKINLKNNELNKKVELNDPIIKEEVILKKIKHFDILRRNPIKKFKRVIARNMANGYTKVFNEDTEIIGLENAKNIKTGAVITANHFSPQDSTVIRYFTNKVGKRNHLNILVEEENIFMEGYLGFLMNNCGTIPVSKNKEYMQKRFYPALKKIFKRKEFVLIYPEEEMWFNYRKPRPLKIGAYHIAAKYNMPIIPCFIEMREKKEEYEDNGFNKLKYIIHILKPIYPDSSKDMRTNKEEMRQKDYELKKEAYEKAYGKELTYEFDKSDIAGLVEEKKESDIVQE